MYISGVESKLTLTPTPYSDSDFLPGKNSDSDSVSTLEDSGKKILYLCSFSSLEWKLCLDLFLIGNPSISLKVLNLLGGLSLTHLLFADDLFFFGSANENTARGFLNCLNLFNS